MNTKLTLKLNQKIIEKAKEYASGRKISLSRIDILVLRNSECEIIITRNGKDYKESFLPIMTADGFLKSLSQK